LKSDNTTQAFLIDTNCNLSLASSLTVTGAITSGGNTVWTSGNDGAGSGLDADLLDGHDTSYFLAASSYTAADVLAKIKTVDGTGSGLDADLLDGINSLGFVRVGAGLTGKFDAQSSAPGSPSDGHLWLDLSVVLA
jgi:hypothetical protein